MVVGAGPAGLAAAGALAEQGLTVQLIDEQPAPGGQVWRGALDRSGAGRRVHPDQAIRRAAAAAEVLRRPGIAYAGTASVIDARTGLAARSGTDERIEIDWLAAAGPGLRGLRTTTVRALIIATGALERPVLFPGATLPGILSAGALQGAMKQAGLVPDGAGTVLAGQGPLMRLVLAQVLRFGGRVDAVLQLASAPAGKPRAGGLSGLAATLASAAVADPSLVARGAASCMTGHGVRTYRGVRQLRAHGLAAIERLSFDTDDGHHELPCRLLAVHDGILPNVQLTRLLGLAHAWHDDQQAFVPVTGKTGRAAEQPIWVAGDGRGIAGWELAALHGELAGLDAASAICPTSTQPTDQAADRQARRHRLGRRIDRRLPARRLVDRLYPAVPIERNATPDTVVCRCEHVTLAHIDAAIAAGAVGANRVKTFTRCGMGACQGRHCGNALTRIVADRLDVSPTAAGALRIRPPLKPTLISDYLDGACT